MEWLVQGLLWLLILAACFGIVRRRLRKWRSGEYCDCCDGSCGGCGSCGCQNAAGGNVRKKNDKS